jgi:hypothetical protein
MIDTKISPLRIVFSGDAGGEAGREGNLPWDLQRSTSSPGNPSSQDQSSTSRQREAVMGWIHENFKMEMEQGRAFASTFLFLEGVPRHQGEDQYRVFVRALERSIYGKSVERHPDKQGIKHVGIVEGGGATGKQVHYHAILCNPQDRAFSDAEFTNRVEVCWMKTPKAMKNAAVSLRIEKIYDLEGWTLYLTKKGTKITDSGSCYLDMLDVRTLKL